MRNAIIIFLTTCALAVSGQQRQKKIRIGAEGGLTVSDDRQFLLTGGSVTFRGRHAISLGFVFSRHNLSGRYNPEYGISGEYRFYLPEFGERPITAFLFSGLDLVQTNDLGRNRAYCPPPLLLDRELFYTIGLGLTRKLWRGLYLRSSLGIQLFEVSFIKFEEPNLEYRRLAGKRSPEIS